MLFSVRNGAPDALEAPGMAHEMPSTDYDDQTLTYQLSDETNAKSITVPLLAQVSKHELRMCPWE